MMISCKGSGRLALTVSTLTTTLLAGQTAIAQEAAEPIELDVVVVTAQKREENLQDVPISISVVRGEALQQGGASQLIDYAAYVPGLQVDNGGSPGRSTISLRGVGPLGPSATIGTYLDDAPVGTSSIYNRGQLFTLDLLPYDIQRVELLRGPQGTLYGASSIGGLLKYVTVSPSLDAFQGRVGGEVVSISHASDPGHAMNAMVNIPFVDDELAMTLSYARRETPGFIDNVQLGQSDVNESDQQGGRVGLLWRPSDRLSLRFSGIWQSIESEENGILMESLDGTPVGNGRSTNVFLPEPFEIEYQYYAGTLEYDFDFATLSSTTTWSTIDITEVTDGSRLYGVLFGGLAPFTLRIETEKVTQELRLTSPSGGRVEWLIGAFYTREDNAQDQVVGALTFDGEPIPGLDPIATIGLPNIYREYAVFGNATFKLTDLFRLTAGLRWARNDQDFRQISAGAIVPPADVPGMSHEDVVTFNISPQLHLSEDTMLYARVATGYRPGGPNVALPDVPPMVDSDEMTDYEIGLKTSLLDRSLTLDLALFYMDWEDIQLSVQFPSGVSGLANAGSARTRGFEGTIAWYPTPGLAFGLNAAYTDAELTSDTPPTVGGLDGDRLPRVPKWSGSFTADYSFDLSAGITAQLGAAVRHVGERLSEVSSSPLAVEADAYTTLNLHAALTFGDRWTLRAYARNVTDSDGDVTRTVSTANPGFVAVVPVQPRTFGVGVDVSF